MSVFQSLALAEKNQSLAMGQVDMCQQERNVIEGATPRVKQLLKQGFVDNFEQEKEVVEHNIFCT